jgi:hypothetical protein
LTATTTTKGLIPIFISLSDGMHKSLAQAFWMAEEQFRGSIKNWD